jgi:hypothetical protein
MSPWEELAAKLAEELLIDPVNLSMSFCYGSLLSVTFETLLIQWQLHFQWYYIYDFKQLY